jgi:hypothetical protein
MLRSASFVLACALAACAAPTGGGEPSSADAKDDGDMRELTGGIVAKSGDFPSTVFIGNDCTAAKVAPDKFLLASHCVYDPQTHGWVGAYLQLPTMAVTSSPTPPANPLAASSDPRTGWVRVHVKGAYVDPAWIANQNFPQQYLTASDVAVIQIAKEDIPAVAAIPVSPVDFNAVQVGTSVAIMGYGCEAGIKGASAGPARLKYSRTKTIPASQATNDQTQFNGRIDINLVDQRYFFTPGQAQIAEDASICPGDSGGPVYRLDASGKPTSIVGVNAYYDFLVQDQQGIAYSNWHTRFNGTWLASVLSGSNKSNFVAIGTPFNVAEESAKTEPPTKGGNVTITWPLRSSTATYSLDVMANGSWTAPCFNSASLQRTTSVLFTGTCPSATVQSVPTSSVTSFRICWAENENWAAAQCAEAPYTGGSAVDFH